MRKTLLNDTYLLTINLTPEVSYKSLNISNEPYKLHKLFVLSGDKQAKKRLLMPNY